VTVKTVLNGYKPARTVLTLSGDKTENYVLTVGGACTAPGYGFKLGGFGEDFNGTWPPPGWTIGNAVTRSPLVWNNNVFWLNDPNYTGGTGKAAEVSSSLSYRIFQYIGPYDTSLITPPIAVSTLPASPVLV